MTDSGSPQAPRRFSLSIRHKIAAMSSALVLAMTLFIVLYVPMRLERQAIAAVTDKAESVSRMLAYSLTAAVVFDDEEVIQNRFDEALLNDDVEYLVLETGGEVRLAHDILTAIEAGYREGVGLRAVDGRIDTYRVAERVVSGDQELGVLYLGLSLDDVNTATSSTRRNIGFLGFMLLFMGLAASYGLSQLVTRPLSRVTEASRRIADGDFSERVQTRAGDEVGTLAASFNLMAERVEDYTRDLQIEVAERSRAEETIRTRHRQQSVIAEIGAKAVVSTDLSSLLQFAASHVMHALDARGCEIFEIVEGSGPRRRAKAEGARDGAEALAEVQGSVQLFEESIPSGTGPFGVLTLSLDLDAEYTNEDRDFIAVVASLLGEAAERHRAQEALRSAEAAQRALLQALPDQMIRVSPDGTVMDVRQPEGFPLHIPVGEALTAALPGEALALAGLVDDAVASEEPGDFEFRVSMDGKPSDYEARVYPGVMGEALVLLRDVTARKELEAQFRHGEKLRSLGVLAGGIAHDFNNLLMGISFNAGMLELEIPDDSSLRTYVDEITDTGTRLAELTNQMLAYSGQGRFVVESVNVGDLVEDTRRLLAVSVSKKIVLDAHLDPDLPSTQADAAQLRQVVLNLMINAADAIGTDQGVITIRTDSFRIDEPYTPSNPPGEPLPPGDYVRLRVKDTGCGMSEETAGQIFEPFFTTKSQGRGLGLGAVLGIVRSHSGLIEVETSLGDGTEFTVLLPGSEARRVEPSAAALETPLVSSIDGGSVLVVDDEPLVRVSACRLLSRLGFDVLEAVDGIDGVDKFLEHRAVIELVILDMTMPGKSGDEVLRDIRAVASEVPVLISSGFSQQMAIDRLADDPFVDFIQKPYRPLDLKAKIEGLRARAAT